MFGRTGAQSDVAGLIECNGREDADSKAELNVGLADIRIDGAQNDLRFKASGLEGLHHTPTSAVARVI